MRLLLDKVGIELDGKIVYHKEHGELLEGFRRVVKLNGRVNYMDEAGTIRLLNNFPYYNNYDLWIKENKELANSNFQGEQHIYRFTGHEIIKKEGETVPNMRLVSTFGGMYVDISKATITSDISFEIDNLFSGISIRIPEGLNVQVDCTGNGSGISAPDTVYEGAPTLFISGRNRYSGLSVFVKPDDVSTEQNQ